MPKMIAIVFELAIFVGALWLLFFLSILVHEMGHAIGFLLATRDTHWHIRVGSGKALLETKRLTVKLLPFDGCFVPLEENRIDTTTKLIATLSGGPVASLVLVAVLLLVRLGGMPLQSEFIASSAIESLASAALSINSFTLVLSLIPTHYFYGETRGMETDGLQMINAVKRHGGNS